MLFFSIIKYFLSVILLVVFYFIWSCTLSWLLKLSYRDILDIPRVFIIDLSNIWLPLNITNIVYVVQWLDLNEESKAKTLLLIEYPRINWCVYWIIRIMYVNSNITSKKARDTFWWWISWLTYRRRTLPAAISSVNCSFFSLILVLVFYLFMVWLCKCLHI